jgi:hypothetical protein
LPGTRESLDSNALSRQWNSDSGDILHLKTPAKIEYFLSGQLYNASADYDLANFVKEAKMAALDAEVKKNLKDCWYCC